LHKVAIRNHHTRHFTQRGIKLVRFQRHKKLLAVSIPLLAVGGILGFIFAPIQLPEFMEFVTGQEDLFALRLSPLAITGAESYLINCEIRNIVNVFDKSNVIRQVVFADSPQFSPAIELSFLISSSGTPEFGRATARTLLSCENSPLSSQGFQAFLVGGSVTTKLDGTDFSRTYKALSTKTKTITGTTDMNGKMNFELNSVEVTATQLDTILKDDYDYTSTIRVLTTGQLTFRQCITTNPLCVGSDATKNWIHTITSNDAFTAFGLIVKGGLFAPVTGVQELLITESGIDANNKLNIATDNNISYKIRIKNYDTREGSPVTKIYDPNNMVFQTRNEGILTSTEEGGTYFVKTGSVALPKTQLGLWCFELQEDPTGTRQLSKKCLSTYVSTTPEVVDPTDTTTTGGATITSGQVRLRYEVTTSSGVLQNDITKAGGIPIAFTPAQLIGVGTNDAFLNVFLQPQVFFGDGVLTNLNIVSGSANIKYSGNIILPDRTVTINQLQLAPNAGDFTKNQASIILPSTKLEANEIELAMKEQGGIPTSPTPITLELISEGTFQLKEVGTEKIWLGTFSNAKFTWNIDYTPASDTGGDDCSITGVGSCSDPNLCDGIIIANTCVIDDLSKCFDANNNPVQCEDLGSPLDPPKDDPTAGEKCFDSSGVETVCDAPTTCDPNTDPNRCGGGTFHGDVGDIPKEFPNGTIGGICESLIGSFVDCAGAVETQQGQLPSFDILSGELLPIAIAIGAGIIIIIIIAVIVVVIRRR